MFEFVFAWAVMASILAGAYFVQTRIEREYTEQAKRETARVRELYRIERINPNEPMRAALEELEKIRRENEDLKEQIKFLIFEKEELASKFDALPDVIFSSPDVTPQMREEIRAIKNRFIS